MPLTRQGSRYNLMDFDPKKDKANKGDNKDNKDNKGDDTLKGTGLMNAVVFPITKYEGDPEKLVEFLEEYNLFADSYGWKEPQKCNRFPLHVKGTARQIVLSLPKEDRDDWKRLGAALTKAILTVTPARTHRAKFRIRIQRPNETVTQFAYDLIVPKSIKPATLKPAFIRVALEAILSKPVRAAGTLPARSGA